jgi:hypothetical protein
VKNCWPDDSPEKYTMNMKSLSHALVGCFLVCTAQSYSATPNRPQTFCNPLNLPYRFQLDAPSRREAADPTMVRFNGEYWLFASKSGGYWHSPDMIQWQFVAPKGLPLEDYAPTVAILNGRLLFTAFNTHGIFSTDDPLNGVWKKIADIQGYPDPDIFVDDDNRVFIYYGCDSNGSIQVVELDPQHEFKIINGPVKCFSADYAHHGWEVSGENNLGNSNTDVVRKMAPWVEGSWMTKYKGVYYLQYSAPGTEFKTYADGVYCATNPLGPFAYAPYSPFSHKPTGFIAGAGHSSLFEDANQHFWHISTMTISQRHMFERRLGIFPTDFAKDGQLHCNTYLADYPQFVPGATKNPAQQNSPGWMLLSYNKPTTTSSSLEKFPAQNAFDEDVRTWWSAASGNPGEWLQVDLGKPCRIDALQVNFADQGVTNLDRMTGDSYRYSIQISDDGTHWKTCVDRSDSQQDSPHDYVQLDEPVKTRYARLTNIHMPGGGFFSVSGFRLFGNGLGKAPVRVAGVQAARTPDSRRVHVSWKPSEGADFYIIRYGTAPDRLWNNYQVYNATNFDINSLNVGVDYFFTVDAVNDSGNTQGTKAVPAK